jgi:AcrR family transcriptional regulator
MRSTRSDVGSRARRIEAEPEDRGPKRGRPRSLTEERIVKAVLKLAGDSRLEDVSMRTLAKELRVPPMTVYNYIPSKRALHELVVNHVLRPIRLPPLEEGSWEQRMRQLQREVRHTVGKHPGLSLSRYGAGGAEAARLAEGVLLILGGAGLDPGDAALAFATLYTFMVGQIEVDVITRSRGGRPEATLEEVTRSANCSRDELFEFGLDAVIEGLKARLLSKPSRSPGARPRRRLSSRRPAPSGLQ